MVGRGLHQHGNSQVRQPQRVGDSAFVAKVRQSNDDAVNFRRMGAEQVRALLRLRLSFHGAVGGLLRAEHDGANARALQRCQHDFAPRTGKVSGKEAAVAHDDSESLHLGSAFHTVCNARPGRCGWTNRQSRRKPSTAIMPDKTFS